MIMEKTTLTKRYIYEQLVVLAETGTMELPEADLKEFAEKELASLARKADKARERAAAKRAEGDALTAAVLEVLTDEYQTIPDIAAQVDSPDATVGKVQHRLGALLESHQAEKTQISVPGTDGQKTRRVMAYKLASAPVEADA
jgi:hypothetical protein